MTNEDEDLIDRLADRIAARVVERMAGSRRLAPALAGLRERLSDAREALDMAHDHAAAIRETLAAPIMAGRPR